LRPGIDEEWRIQPNLDFWQNEPKFPTVKVHSTGLLAHPSVQIQMLGPVNHFRRGIGPVAVLSELPRVGLLAFGGFNSGEILSEAKGAVPGGRARNA
jgi:hypothetical protein